MLRRKVNYFIRWLWNFAHIISYQMIFSFSKVSGLLVILQMLNYAATPLSYKNSGAKSTPLYHSKVQSVSAN